MLADRPGLAEAVYVVSTVLGLGLVVLVLTLLVRRWRAASPALRRLLWPVLAAGSATLLRDRRPRRRRPGVRLGCRESAPLLLVVCAGLRACRVPLRDPAEPSRAILADGARAWASRPPRRSRTRSRRRCATRPSRSRTASIPPAASAVPAGWTPRADPCRSRRRRPGRAVQRLEQGGRSVAAVTLRRLALRGARARGGSDRRRRPRALERAPPGRAPRRDQARGSARADGSEPALERRHGRPDLKVQRRHARGERLRTEDELRGKFFWEVFIDPEEREAMIARFMAAGPDYAAERVREHLHERSRRAARHLLAQRAGARRGGPRRQHRRGRPRHHRAQAARAGGGAPPQTSSTRSLTRSRAFSSRSTPRGS